jgi:hypothetical protein
VITSLEIFLFRKFSNLVVPIHQPSWNYPYTETLPVNQAKKAELWELWERLVTFIISTLHHR